MINRSPIILPNVNLYLSIQKFNLTLLGLPLLKEKGALIWRHWKPSHTKISCSAKHESVFKLFHTRTLLNYHAVWHLAGNTALFCTIIPPALEACYVPCRMRPGKSNENLSMSDSSKNGMILLERIPHGGEKTVRFSAQIKIPWPQEKCLYRRFCGKNAQ